MASPVEDVPVGSDLREALRRLTVDRDGDEFIIARSDLDLYVAVPRPGAVLIEALRDGASLAAATEQASDAAGEEVDATDFLTGLGEAGLLDNADGAGTVTGTRIGWVERIPRAVVRPLFGRIAWAIYVAAALTAVFLLLFRPDLRPLFDDIWFLSDPIWSLLALFAMSMIIAGGHECWHWLAGRALGVPARFRVSRRGVFVVFESDLSPLVTLPRRARYSPMLAGLAFDIVLLAAALLLRLGYREEVLGVPPAFDRFLGALIFGQLVVVAWQVSGVAFRSDSYAVLANALGCHNLYRATALTVKRGLWRLHGGEAKELAGIGSRDRSVANWFWLVYVAGGFLMFWVLFSYLIPFSYGMISWVGPNITALAADTFVFWQSLALVALLLAQFAVVPLIARRERRQGRRAAPTPTVSPETGPVRSPDSTAWRVIFAVLAIFTLAYAGNDLKKYVGASTDATATNLAAAAEDDSCLPGQQVTILDFPHVSARAAADAVYNSNPPTSGAHYGAAVAPGIYSKHLPAGLSVHAMEHGRVVIHYRPDTPADIVRELESIAKRYARDTVLHPNPEIDTQIALTAWGRIDTLERYDEERIVTFVDTLRNRYNHHSTIEPDECSAGR
ncbi:MAG: DUF3105 domain-containing protein [Geodermatophilaceae bacterium]|nr:DUF3105 domain-containing protein [Geodermatophilaceae bacterium]